MKIFVKSDNGKMYEGFRINESTYAFRIVL